MQVVLDNAAEKQYKKINEPYKSRIAVALNKLGLEPPEGDIKKLQGRDGYRVVVGNYRILFDIVNNKVGIFKIAPRGNVYKEK